MVDGLVPNASFMDKVAVCVGLRRYIQAGAGSKRRRLTAALSSTTEELAVKGHRLRRKHSKDLLHDHREQLALRHTPMPEPPKERAPGYSWNVGSRREPDGIPSGLTRKAAEIRDREKWVARLAVFAREGGLPVALKSLQEGKPELLTLSIGQGRRAGTLKRRCLDWARARRYFVGL